jgi:adenosylcobinamide-GDP ribazoletransferase
MIADFVTALTFLTILPAPQQATSAAPGRAFSFFPLVGLIIGAIVALVASIRFLPSDLVAFLALLVWVALTGGLHLDGFADSCDGLLATVSPERRLDIMKDSRAGSWAVIGVVLLLLGKWVALRTILPLLLLVPPVAGRWAMVLAVAAFPGARSSGLATYFRAGFGRTQLVAASVTALLIMALVGILADWRVILAVAAAPLLAVVGGRWAANRLGGGLTGDVYGALCELVELVCLILLCIA